jgi:hypothetical protein
MISIELTRLEYADTYIIVSCYVHKSRHIQMRKLITVREQI